MVQPLHSPETQTAPFKTFFRKAQSQQKFLDLPTVHGRCWSNLRNFSVEQKLRNRPDSSREGSRAREWATPDKMPLDSACHKLSADEVRKASNSVGRVVSHFVGTQRKDLLIEANRMSRASNQPQINVVTAPQTVRDFSEGRPHAPTGHRPQVRRFRMETRTSGKVALLAKPRPQAQESAGSSENSEERSVEETKKPEKYFVKKMTRIEKLWTAILNMRKMRLTPKELAAEQIFSKIPYEHKDSEQFFIAVKLRDVAKINEMLKANRYLVFDFDSVKQTPLHWAVKRGYAEVVEALLRAGAKLDAMDLMGQTPLFLAAKHSFVEVVKLLISQQADPFQPNKKGVTPHDATSNQFIKLYIKKAQLVAILMKWASPVRRISLWSKWMDYIFYDPLCKSADAVAELAKLWSEKEGQ